MWNTSGAQGHWKGLVPKYLFCILLVEAGKLFRPEYMWHNIISFAVIIDNGSIGALGLHEKYCNLMYMKIDRSIFYWKFLLIIDSWHQELMAYQIDHIFYSFSHLILMYDILAPECFSSIEIQLTINTFKIKILKCSFIV